MDICISLGPDVADLARILLRQMGEWVVDKPSLIAKVRFARDLREIAMGGPGSIAARSS
jgi:hypothetical protein